MRHMACNGCTDRHLGCHATCEKYINEVQEIGREKSKIRMMKQKNHIYIEYKQAQQKKIRQAMKSKKGSK